MVGAAEPSTSSPRPLQRPFHRTQLHSLWGAQGTPQSPRHLLSTSPALGTAAHLQRATRQGSPKAIPSPWPLGAAGTAGCSPLPKTLWSSGLWNAGRLFVVVTESRVAGRGLSPSPAGARAPPALP